MDILDDMGVSKLSAKVFLKVNYSFKSLCEYSFLNSNAENLIETKQLFFPQRI